MGSVSDTAKRKTKLIDMIEKVIAVGNNTVVDSTQQLWELRTLQIEIGDHDQITYDLYRKLSKAVIDIGLKGRKIENDIEDIRNRLTRILKFFDREFERQARNRERMEETNG